MLAAAAAAACLLAAYACCSACFAQADLEEDDVYILDTFTTVFVWLGSEANEEEKRAAHSSAEEYIKAQGYAEGTPIVAVPSGAEPSIFTCHFLGWSHEKKDAFVDPYAAKLAAVQSSNPSKELPAWAASPRASLRSSSKSELTEPNGEAAAKTDAPPSKPAWASSKSVVADGPTATSAAPPPPSKPPSVPPLRGMPPAPPVEEDGARPSARSVAMDEVLAAVGPIKEPSPAYSFNYEELQKPPGGARHTQRPSGPPARAPDLSLGPAPHRC